jgi:uncharacterized protein
VTPTRPPGPDLDAALRFLDAPEPMYDLEVDETELRERTEEMNRYYEELGQRLQTPQEETPRTVPATSPMTGCTCNAPPGTPIRM